MLKSVFKKGVVAVMTALAKAALRKFKPRIIAITGSVGKTTTKDAIYSVLKESYKAAKSQKSYNSEIGVPLTILGLANAWNNPFHWFLNFVIGFCKVYLTRNFPQVIVVEVGADKPGDIESIAKWLRPDVVVLTRLSNVPVHVEFFSSPEALKLEKRKLLEHLRPGGAAVLNTDDNDIYSMRRFGGGRIYTFGVSADFSYKRYTILYSDGGENKSPVGVSFYISLRGSEFEVKLLGCVGIQHVYPALSAAAVGSIFNLSIDKIKKGLEHNPRTRGRMRLLEGMRGATIIDDTYNSSPVAAAEAVRVLSEIDAKNRVAVLGDMLELGQFSVSAHRELGTLVSSVADTLITVGKNSLEIGLAAAESGMTKEKIHHFLDSISAAEHLKSHINSGDLILVKGSQSIRMEKIVEQIMAEPGRAGELLVRQDREWKNKD